MTKDYSTHIDSVVESEQMMVAKLFCNTKRFLVTQEIKNFLILIGGKLLTISYVA